jgi:GNAT superfamily N-acetyltransferase
MLTVLADDLAPYRRLALPSDVRVDRDDETLMTTSLALTAVPPLPEGFVARWDVVGPRVTYVVECGERVAAEGTIGVLGTDAVVDAVETTPRFRRQGLARHVMATVQVAAVERGATHGILAATVDGRRLYESLGWRARMPMWSLMGVGPAGTS